MELKESTRKSLLISNTVTETIYKHLLENCFAVLSGNEEIHSEGSLFGSKPDQIKELHANLLIAILEFVRHGLTSEDVHLYLSKECSIQESKCKIFVDMFDIKKQGVEISLLNIGRHPPHVTNVDWKIDFVVKLNHLDHFEGPLFRIGLITEQYDETTKAKKIDRLCFVCNSQEMQDLVYKLKDAVRHCERLTEG